MRLFDPALRLNSTSNKPHFIKQPKQEYKENLLDGLRIYHNPFATHPLEPGLFRNNSVFQWYFEGNETLVEQHEGDLLFRSVQTFVPPGSHLLIDFEEDVILRWRWPVTSPRISTGFSITTP